MAGEKGKDRRRAAATKARTVARPAQGNNGGFPSAGWRQFGPQRPRGGGSGSGRA